MKKTFKRAGVAVLSMAMLLSMGAMTAITSNAVDNTAQNITIQNTYGGTYSIYKVLEATANSTETAYEYAWASGFTAANSGVADIAAIEALTPNTAAMKTFVDALVTQSQTASPVATDVATGTPTNLAPGYYLIVNTGGTQMTVQPTLISVRSNMTSESKSVTPKTSDVSIDKWITGVAKGTASQSVGTTDSKSAKPNTAEVAVGNVVSYEIDTKTPKYASNVTSLSNSYYIEDTPSTGLTIDKNSIVVSVDTDGTAGFGDADRVYYGSWGSATKAQYSSADIISNITEDSTSKKITITFNNNFIVNNQDKDVKVTLSATVNQNAVVDAANTNETKLHFNNDYYNGGDSYAETGDTTRVYRTKLTVTKTFSNGPSSGSYPIAGFTLYKGTAIAANAVGSEMLTTASDNVLVFEELSAGTYVLSETTTPSGYHKADDITFTISADKTSDEYDGTWTLTGSSISLKTGDHELETTVNNVIGHTLPGTGGMGTILFTVGGAAVVLLAGALFVVYMRRRKVEE